MKLQARTLRLALALACLGAVGAGCRAPRPNFPGLPFGSGKPIPAGIPKPPLPGRGLPGLPKPPVPRLGKPSLPGLPIPKIGKPSLSGLPKPSLPGLPKPPIPKLGKPSLPGIPKPPLVVPKVVVPPSPPIVVPRPHVPRIVTVPVPTPPVVVPSAPGVVVAPVGAYVPPRSLSISFGDPTVGTDEDVLGSWSVDPKRSAAIYKAWLRHLAASYGGNPDEVDVTKLEENFRESDGRLELTDAKRFVLTFATDDGTTRIEGSWRFEEGVLSLDHEDDVDGIPVRSEAIYEFNYYANESFTGLVVVNHSLGIALGRSEGGRRRR